MTIQRVVLFGNDFQTSTSGHPLQQWLSRHGIEVLTEGQLTSDDFRADMIISVGGDGTFLRTARRVGSKEIPILGINTGRLGFLAAVSPCQAEDVLAQVLEGHYLTERRSVLQVIWSGSDDSTHEAFGLNEVAVLKQDVSSMISIEADINGQHLTTYQADGLIVNTPTGSTGYALSVGGPVIQPQSRMMGLVPVAPHSLTMRPIVITDDAVVTLRVLSRSHRFLVSVDGNSTTCDEGTTLTIHRAPYDIHLVHLPDASFFATLRTKLMWGSDVRN